MKLSSVVEAVTRCSGSGQHTTSPFLLNEQRTKFENDNVLCIKPRFIELHSLMKTQTPASPFDSLHASPSGNIRKNLTIFVTKFQLKNFFST